MISGYAGTTWPWKQGVPDWEYDEDVIYTAIKDVIFTMVGERKMNGAYGSGTVNTVFENKGPLLQVLASREITMSLQQHLPMIRVLNVDVQEGEKDTDPVDIFVDYLYQGVRKSAQVPLAA